jgi:N-methylhydantoinase A
VFLGGRSREVPLFARSALLAGQRFAGPAVIAQADTTTCVPEGVDVTVDPFGNLLLDYRD